ncbi:MULTISPECIES: bifunctional 3-(3-hydroxy-phenyl)propionate/3-hydroxycinnamic acid hydroxylase [unclassified Streptomyces]|uniref:bifunctional 3-(3-hydroxy-phenyl)propionate/3-hydroxycinnamic acid hydroxylase n=1 Tax=unclassified Streptomyces TaxID=2593676 RepID=UPI0016606C32|nr:MULTISPECIES: bifunctional 3-(3-hydroxy-phenyl)propionate/3-hydroxycinnamic acid hydroxylase [unclassified Streptomyces]MBD0711829.1 monooxygenase [Streptomyces sp. CBMA291]MBD0714649.1 monooxygenase [Streptomyces sp. CBMA370]
MRHHYDTDVVIIGYGPSGVAAANALGSLGISALAFERHQDVYNRARAVTVNDWTMRLFQQIGLDERVKADMDPTAALRWITYEGRELMRVPFPPGTLGHATSYAIYQPAMEQTLREGAARFGDGIRVSYGTEVTDLVQDADGVTATVRDLATGETSTIRARYALACHGGETPTRERLGVNLVGDTLDVRWVVIDGKVKRWWPDRHILTFWSDRERPVVDIALGGDNHRWEFPLKPGETDADFADHEDLWPLLDSLGVSRDDIEIHGHAFYSHHVRSAESWRIGERLFLLGDAAHLMPPWAGSGMQSGIRDAFNIAWKLAGVLGGTLPESILDSYEAERRPDVDFYTQVSVQLGRLIKQELTPEEQAGMAAAQENGELPPLLWPPAYAAGWFTGIDAPAGRPTGIVGRMIPQPRAATVTGLIGPLDDLLGDAFVVLGDNVDPRTLLTEEEREAWTALGARFVALRSTDRASEGTDDIVDIDGTLVDWLREHGARVIAVRPDRFVAAADTTGLSVPA